MSTFATGFPWFTPPAIPMPDIQGMFDRLTAMPRIAEIARKVQKGATPFEVTYAEDRLKVMRYISDEKKQYGPPLLLVFALVNRSYILDLLPGKSVVQQFLKRGFDVYMIDWGTPTEGDKILRGEDYINRYLHNVIQHICHDAGVEQISLMGYCMGGTLSAMYTALHEEMVRNLILMTAPIDFTSEDNLLSVWANPKYFDVDQIVDTFGNAPPWL